MKKRGELLNKKIIFISFLFALLLILPFILSAENSSGDISIVNSNDDTSKINKAYTCLEDKIDDRECSSLSLQEKIFSLLAVKKCKSELINDAKDDECWPKSGCNIKSTAQVILALDKTGTSTIKAQKWLTSQNKSTENVDWILQIDNPDGETSCSIKYAGSSYSLILGDDKKITAGADTCFDKYLDNYWLRISPSCYNKEFQISCNKKFSTNLLFKRKDSSTIHVSGETNGASAEGTTIETVNSLCFNSGNSCDYESSLWTALVLDYLDEDISPFLPYLITMQEENNKFLPEAFLYLLTGDADYRNDLLLKQKDSYWDESGDKFYDTALALYPFQYDAPLEKGKSQEWLLEIQGADGCWDSGNIVNNAFLLYSIWPKTTIVPEDDCEDSSYYCLSSIDCSDAKGDELDYDCNAPYVCCSEDKLLEGCFEQGGEVCEDDEDCTGGIFSEASDLIYGERCCVGGDCGSSPTPIDSECVENLGTCRGSCESNEEENFYDCDYSSEVCCIEKETPPAPLLSWWIWLLIILIILVIAGIIFRDKLRPYWFKIKSKFGKSKPMESHSTERFPESRMPQRPVQRRMLPPTHRRPSPSQVSPKPSKELDDVLRKLKDMGK